MARIADTDDFSNVSWHSEHNNHPNTMASGSSSAADGTIEPPLERADLGDPNVPRPKPHAEAAQMTGGGDTAGMGGEVLNCTVTEPHKENEGTKDTFVSYMVTTNTTFSSFTKPHVSVRRRFTDFLFLFNTLSREYPASAVPPIPDKKRMEYVRGDRFGIDFTQRRAYSLQRFLTRCALHPVLRRAQILHTFLESPDWNATMRARSSRANGGGAGPMSPGASMSTDGSSSGGGSGGVFDNFADTFINAFTKVHKPDKRFLDVKEKSDKLDEDLNQVEKVVARLARREADIEADLKDLAEQFQKLITLEPGVEAAIHAYAASVEDTAQGLKKLKDHTDQDYLGSLRDMAAYSGALKNLLKAREQKQLDYEQLTEYLNKATHERDSLGGPSSAPYNTNGGQSSSTTSHHHQSTHTSSSSYTSAASGPLNSTSNFLRSKLEDVRGVDHETSRRDRLRRLELRIDELTREAEAARKTSEMFDDEVFKEVADFERIKRVEFKRQLGGLADAHVEYFEDVGRVWERYVQEMEREGVLAP